MALQISLHCFSISISQFANELSSDVVYRPFAYPPIHLCTEAEPVSVWMTQEVQKAWSSN